MNNEENKLKEVKIGSVKDLPVSEKIDIVNDKLDALFSQPKDSKKKWFKFPWRVRSKQKKLAVKGKVQVILLKENRNIETLICQIEDGMVKINNIFYNAAELFVYLWQGKFPTLVLPEWSLVPISQTYDELGDETKKAYAQKHIIQAMKKAELEDNKKLGGGKIIWFLIIGVVIFYLLFGRGA